MGNPVKFLTDPTLMSHFHAVAVVIWLLLIIPSLIWWKDMVAWVVVMSLWANVASHWAGYAASRVEKKQEDSNGND